MFRRHLSSRTLQIGALGVALCLCAKPGSGEDKGKAERRACAATYKNALQVEQAGHLRQAKDLLLSCAKATCGALVKQQCTARYAQLESDIPSVVPLVSDENGEPRVDVQVTIDNELLTSRLDGRALPVDPGVHEFSFTADGAVVATQKVMIVQGQRNRPIAVALQKDKRGKRVALGAAPPSSALDAKASLDKPAVDKSSAEKPEREAVAAEKSASDKSSPEKTTSDSSSSEPPPLEVSSKGGPGAMPYVLGTLGIAGLGGAGLLTYWGRKDNEQLAQCAPNCSPESVDHIKKLYLAADISLGVGAAALATSVIWFIASPSSKEKPPSQAAYRFDVQPTPTGGFAAVSGRF
jgi:hypothetical protein